MIINNRFDLVKPHHTPRTKLAQSSNSKLCLLLAREGGSSKVIQLYIKMIELGEASESNPVASS